MKKNLIKGFLAAFLLVGQVMASDCTGVLKREDTKNFGGKVSAVEVDWKIFFEEGQVVLTRDDVTVTGPFNNGTLKIRSKEENFDLKLKEIKGDSTSNSIFFLDVDGKDYNKGMMLVGKVSGVIRCKE